MGVFDGHVLRGPRVAQGNATTTESATGGVCGDVKFLGNGWSATFIGSWGSENLVRMSYYQYESAILTGREGQLEEYIAWAANSSNLSVVESASNAIKEGTVAIPWGDQYVYTQGMANFSRPVSGEVTFTTGSDAITGVGTSFLSALSPGAYIYYGLSRFTVKSVESDTEATLTELVASGFLAAAGSLVVIEPLAGASQRVVLTDNGGRSIAGVVSITIVLGDDDENEEHELYVGADISCADPDTGLILIEDTDRTRALFRPAEGSLPAMSSKRGDQIREVVYFLASPRFWWTKNDPENTRFGWNGARQRWEPFKGGAPKSLGKLTPDDSYEFSPRPKNLTVGDYLPGTFNADEYCMVRLGLRPDSSSDPVGDAGDANGGVDFRGILVVPNDVAESGDFDFGSYEPPPAAIVGETSGTLIWNPQMIGLHAGKTVWYIYKTFESTSNGAVGKLEGSDSNPLFLSPIPGMTERPLVRIGSRRWLQVIYMDSDAQLSGAVGADPAWPPGGSVAISLSTGKLHFSPSDVIKAGMGDVESPNPDFEKAFGGVEVFYDGVSLTRTPQPPRAPVLIESALIFSSPMPPMTIPEAPANPGLGTSGVWHLEDGTGAVPDGSQGINHRYGESGLVRRVEGIGDSFVFTPNRPLEKIKQYNDVDDLDAFKLMPFLIRKGRACIAKGSTSDGTKASVGLTDLVRFANRPVYFQQSDLTPSSYAEDTRIVSRMEGPYTLRGDESLKIVVGNQAVEWTAAGISSGEVSEEGDPYPAADVADDITTTLAAQGAPYKCSAVMNRLVLHPDMDPPYEGWIEILPGFNGVKDLSGCAALGFNPFWSVKHPLVNPVDAGTAADPNWLADNGSSLGLWRSPYNEDGSGSEADFSSRGRMGGEILGDVSESPFVFIMQEPLEDVAGVDDGVFFEILRGPYRKRLEHLDNIKHMFRDGKFAWIGSKTSAFASEAPVSNIPLGTQDVISETLHPALGGYFMASLEGEPFALMQEDEDYILPYDGLPGSAILTETIGDLLLFGSKAAFDEGGSELLDDSAAFEDEGILVGYRLKIPTGDATGSYVITAVEDGKLGVEPVFPAGSGESPMAWEIYRMKTVDEIDAQMVVDHVYDRFNHLPEEPFIVRLMTGTGLCPASEGEQSSGRLSVDMSKDILRSRPLYVRFGLDGPDHPVVLLKRSELGRIANSSIFIPPGPSFDDRTFKLVVGRTELAVGTELTEVVEFSEDPGAGAGAEFISSTGEVRFGSALLESLDQSGVVFAETFTNPTSMQQGDVEADPGSGDINLSSDDITSYAGQDVYWVARMITEDRADVVPNPMAGAFMFKEPLLEGQMVEVEYQRCDPGGDLIIDEDGVPEPLITEILPLFVRGEVCTRVSAQVYSFNPDLKTLFRDADPVIYVGAEMQNFAGIESCEVDWDENLLYFTYEVSESARVKISYGVLEAFGGEIVYTVSKPPVYRPPFYIPESAESFKLVSDRTGDLLPGALMRLGGHMFYLKSVAYDAGSNTTSVGIFPPAPPNGAGSLAPGNDAISFITATPVSSTVGGAVVADAPEGFMVTPGAILGLDSEPVWEPVSKGRVELVFLADLSKVVQAGHLLEMAGIPYTIVAVQVSEDGRRTALSITPNFIQGYAFGTDEVRLSTRPVYPQGNINYIGSGPYLFDLPYEIVLWGEKDSDGTELPGKTLAAGVDYSADPNTGDIAFQLPKRPHVEPGQRLTFSRTRVIMAVPSVQDGVLMFPRFGARYKHGILPSDDNGLKSATLLGTYTFRSPDTFYYRAVPLLDYMGEVSVQMIQEIKARGASYGASTGAGGGPKNWDNGRVGLKVERTSLLDKDRAARKYLGFYNKVVVCFEQISETITGRIVGDRDRKFRFWVGEGLEWTPPGWENPVTGFLNPRNLWATVFMEHTGSTAAAMRADEDDWVVVPSSSYLDEGAIDGDFVDADEMRYLITRQRELVKNDVDDLVIVSRKRPTILFRLFPLPHFILKAKGRYERLSEPNEFSRIFPERARAFTNLFPGVGNNPPKQDYGEHLFLGIRDWKLKSTFFSTSGTISNPVLGTIENIFSCRSGPRTSRARIFAWSPSGFPEYDAVLGTDFTTNPRPAILATPGLLADFPLNPDTGAPDPDRMAANSETGGPDLTTGDWEISTPPWTPGTKVQFGRPDGTVFSPGHEVTVISIFGAKKVNPVFVEAIHAGCCITFNDSDGDAVLDANSFVEVTSEDGGTPLELFKGDTVMQSLGAGAEVEPSDPPTLEDMARLAAAMPGYRTGFDISYNGRRGRFRDMSLPSFNDPTFFGLQEIFGQNPPKPNTRIESEVLFHQSELEPVEIPALLGEPKDDSGDYTLPYLGAANTEIQRLQAAQRGGIDVLMSDCSSLHATSAAAGQTWKAVYPDEVLGADGAVSGSGDNPAAMTTAADLLPVATNGGYDDHTGIGDLRRWDLLLMEADDTSPAVVEGAQGILTVGEVTDGVIETPRFITPSPAGARISYKADKALGWVADDEGYASGLRVDQLWIDNTADPVDGFEAGFRWTETRLSFSSVGSGFITLDDGDEGGEFTSSGMPEGGLNDLFANAEAGTTLKLNILRRPADLADPQAGDGEVKLELWIKKTSSYAAGEGIEDCDFELSVDGGGTWTRPSVFWVDVDDPPDGIPEQMYNGPLVWFHTASGVDDIIIRTVHPEDEHHDATDGAGIEPGGFGYDPSPVVDGGNGYLDTLYVPGFADEDNVAVWFPWGDFVHVAEDNEDDPEFYPPGHPNAGDPNLDYLVDHFYTYGGADGSISADDLYLGFYIDLDVVEGRTALIGEDRLTFGDTVDFRTARPRGYQHPFSLISLEFELYDIATETALWLAGTPWSVMSTVNDPATSMNEGSRLTFSARPIGAGTYKGVGWWGASFGTVKAMAWEGHGNTPIAFSGALFSAVPSSQQGKDSPAIICGGSGAFGGAFAEAIADPLVIDTVTPVLENRILVYNEGASVASMEAGPVVPGDVVVVQQGVESALGLSTLERGTSRSGTYLVRHAVAASPVVPTFPTVPTELMVRALHLTASVPSSNGWARSYMPKVTGVDPDYLDAGGLGQDHPDFDPSTAEAQDSGRIWVESIEPLDWNGAPADEPADWTGHAWDESGDLYILRASAATNIDEDTWRATSYRVEYSSIHLDQSSSDFDGTAYFKVDDVRTISDSMADGNGTINVITNDAAGDGERWDLFALEVGKTTFGIRWVPVSITGQGLPKTGATGHTEKDVSQLGFAALTVRHNGLEYDEGSDGVWNAGTVEFGVNTDGDLEATAASTISIYDANYLVPTDPGAFHEVESDYQYTGAPILLDLKLVANLDWQAINKSYSDDVIAPAAHVTDINALMPGSSLETKYTDPADNTVTHPSFYAEAGLFLEPSFPMPTADLASTLEADGPRVVAAADFNSDALELAATEVGTRAEAGFIADLSEIGIAAKDNFLYERTLVSVRRIRRWHDVQDSFANNLAALRYAYETRWGTIASYTQTGTFGTFSSAEGGTQLGGFDDGDVNINPGDMVRVYSDATGELIAEGEISSIQSADTLVLAPPGLIVYDDPDGANLNEPWEGLRFEVYLNIAPVPHQQSNEQLLELATEEVIYKRTAVMNDGSQGQQGGYVEWNFSEVGSPPDPVDPPDLAADAAAYNVWKSAVYDASVNILTDTDAGVAPGQINFQQIGVDEGDILIIDPASVLRPPGSENLEEDALEEGTRPYGDLAVEGRTGYVRGRPAELDDNRGYYVVSEIPGPTQVKVLPFEESPFAGSRIINKVSGPPDTAFALYPTVGASALTGSGDPSEAATEAQSDLRPTAFVGQDLLDLVDGDGDTEPHQYSGNPFSIAPLSYTIIRPSDFFSEESLELILFHRERILSLMEHLRRAVDGTKRGTYRDFQELRHIDDLGSPTVDEEGLGLLSNAFIYGVMGQFDKSEFINDADCLSILDRRVQCQDYELDLTRPPYSDPADPFYTAMRDQGRGRPLVVDMIDNVLNNSDRFRELRYSWLTYRAHRVDGTLPKVERFDRELPKRIREMERMRRMTEKTGR